MVPGIWGGYIAVWLWLGPKIRRESSEMRWLTPTDLIAANVDTDNRRRVAALAAILIVFCFVFYIAAQFDAAAQAFVGNFSMERSSALLLGATIILVYCLLGGFWAASITDMLQALVMMFAAILVPAIAVYAAGGPAQVFVDVAQVGHESFSDWHGGYGTWIFLGFVLGVWGIGLGALGQPQLIARLMAVRGERERRQGFLISIVWAIIVFSGMAALALAARSLAVDTSNGEQLFYLMAERLLPPVLAGLVIAAILSAVMSTVDSLLLAASAAVSHDLGIARRFDIGEVWVARVVMTIIAVAAVLLALFLPDTIFNRVLFAWSALGAAFGPILVARVSGHEPPGPARMWSIVLGFGITVFFYTLGTFDPAGTSSSIGRALIEWANLPGDPFERVVPWLPALLILFFWPRKGAATASGADVSR
jgi:sodium/proline symporter